MPNRSKIAGSSVSLKESYLLEQEAMLPFHQNYPSPHRSISY